MVRKKRIKNEEEFEKWFENNFIGLGYEKIIKKNKKRFPDYIMLKGNRRIRVELETKSSNFVLHNHDKRKVDIVICIDDDINLGLPTIEITELRYKSNIERISATIDKKTSEIIQELLKSGRYRNKSHLIEEAINNFLLKNGIKKNEEPRPKGRGIKD